MEKVAFIQDERFIYWRSILLALGVLCALLMAVAVRLGRGRRLAPLLIAMPLAVAGSVYAARIIHWYCRFESYASLKAALTDFTGGGYSLIGVFLASFLACVLVRAVFLTRDLPALLDDVSPAAAIGVAVGRIADYFSAADRGKMFFSSEKLLRLPWSAPVVNATSGVTEWRFATFFAQSGWAAFLFVLLILRMLIPSHYEPRRKQWRNGDLFALFITLYCLGQILLDSTRYDALFLRSNGFVSLEQIVCGVVVVTILAIYSVRSIQVNRFHLYHPLLWLASLLGLGLAGFMEYYVQRHGDAFVFAYGMMAEGLLIFFCVVLAMKRTTQRKRPTRKERAAREKESETAPAETAAAEA